MRIICSSSLVVVVLRERERERERDKGEREPGTDDAATYGRGPLLRLRNVAFRWMVNHQLNKVLICLIPWWV